MNKSDIILSIEELFWRSGFTAVSMADIADRIGIRKASLYYHFPSKESLCLAVLDSSYDRYRKFLEGLLSEEGVESGFLHSLLSRLISFALTDHNVFAVAHQVAFTHSPEITEWIEMKKKESDEILIRWLERYDFSDSRQTIFLLLIDSIGKRYCMLEKCDTDRRDALVSEMIALLWDEKKEKPS